MRLPVALAIAMGGSAAAVAADGPVSVERGALVAIIGGCHDCHTDGYAITEGQIDPAKALTGSPVGFQGPWGTTYPSNLRLTLAGKSEDAFVAYAQTFKTRSPMPWFNVHHFPDEDLRSFYLYVKSLGEPGAPAPAYVEPGGTPKTPYIVFAPPQMPAQ